MSCSGVADAAMYPIIPKLLGFLPSKKPPPDEYHMLFSARKSLSHCGYFLLFNTRGLLTWRLTREITSTLTAPNE